MYAIKNQKIYIYVLVKYTNYSKNHLTHLNQWILRYKVKIDIYKDKILRKILKKKRIKAKKIDKKENKD